MDDKVLAELERLREENGGALTSEAIVEAAKAKGSPLHDLFDWDLKRAARCHWINQAEGLIRRFRLVYRPTTKEEKHYTVETVQVPRFSPHPSEEGYADTAALLDGPHRADLLRSETERFAGHVRRVCSYFRAAGIVEVAERVELVLREARQAVELLEASDAGQAAVVA